MPPFVLPLATPPNSAGLDPNGERISTEQARASVWSDTQTSKTPTRPKRAKSTGRGTQSTETISRPLTQSFSTVDGAFVNENQGPGAFRVVIDRADPNTKQYQNGLMPTLDVSIPHYRLGDPRFSARGTAFLHSSVYTGTSTNEEIRLSAFSGPEYERLFPMPPGTETQSILSRRHSHTSPQKFSIRTNTTGKTDSTAAVTSTPTFHRPREPITASIYDRIAADPDDPATVRYAPATGEIVAASPARIITQITSKNFLDYELLSDFFLTVRAYLSTHDLEAYLLARFEWAINRFDDDGRVIRVRAFAALRHWILNYFPYDFVADRDLRVKFCHHLNILSRLVRERSNGSSDMKLILDLKKCWNGRCAIYWDNTESEDTSRRDLDINPGGIVGSRDSSLTHPSQLRNTHATSTPLGLESSVDAEKSDSALNNWFDAVLEAGNTSSKGHERQISVATSRSLPTSPTSEQSVPATSCTIPSKGLKRLVAQPGQGAGVHPVPVPITVKRVCPAAPSATSNDPTPQKKHAHKRSGSFSDAFRDKRASLSSMHERFEDSPIMTFPFSGSLIRGSVLPPGSAYIDTFAPPSPTRELRSLMLSESDDEDINDPRNPSPVTPGMKNFFGSIRRALSSKQVPVNQPSNFGTTSASTPSIPGIKYPKNAGALGESNVQQLEASKKHTRVDLLCADVTEMFQRALQEMARQEVQPLNSIGVAFGNEGEQPSPDKAQPSGTPQHDGLQRGYSETTYGSRSIVIVDDTGLEPPLPSMPARFTQAERSSVVEPSTSPTADQRSHSSKVPIASSPTTVQQDVTLGDILDALPPVVKSSKSKPVENVSSVVDPVGNQNVMSSSRRPGFSRVSNGRSYMSTHSGSRSLRKYASFQSGITRNDVETTMSSGFVSGITDSVSDMPQRRMLRRRPGGDLRANENVHDLEPITRSRSTGSITTYTDSFHDSELRMTKNHRGTSDRESRNVPHSVQSQAAVSAAEKQLSLVRTHSSQPALRPSFEAAVAEFAQIPDDEGGDIEATLLKLEGKYRKSPIDAALAPPERADEETMSSAQSLPIQASSGKIDQQSNLSKDTIGEPPPSKPAQLGGLSTKKEDDSSQRHNMTTSLYAESEESYDSTPLLERGLSTKSQNKDRANPIPSADVPRPLFSPTLNSSADRSSPSLLSAVYGQDRGSTRRTRYVSSIPTTTDSFLLDEDEFLSDLSSEISLDDDDRNAIHEEEYGSSQQLVQEGARTPRPGYESGELPSPPMTSGNAHNELPPPNVFNRQHKPPTPEPSPVSRIDDPSKSSTPASSKTPAADPLPTLKHNFLTRRHIPFIMSFDSGVLAQQFTIIERDALNEINWLDLINMRWHHKSPSTQNWVEFLRSQEPTGIELVTARFNVIVKWALSEIVLTQSLEERALCIMKFIHIAQYCRKIHNYATLLQITIALTSVDCSRLTKTWELVPPAERKVVRDLETLITPIKNFHNLRQEMETANSEDGCIPVVAMYIHDLTYNSQKPSQIASSRDGEPPLINFERYRTTATIVKSLLRLIDASAKYNFQPVAGALDRCLWMASLSDEMIRIKSKELQ